MREYCDGVEQYVANTRVAAGEEATRAAAIGESCPQRLNCASPAHGVSRTAQEHTVKLTESMIAFWAIRRQHAAKHHAVRLCGNVTRICACSTAIDFTQFERS
jgi:hypothetical protein